MLFIQILKQSAVETIKVFSGVIVLLGMFLGLVWVGINIFELKIYVSVLISLGFTIFELIVLINYIQNKQNK